MVNEEKTGDPEVAKQEAEVVQWGLPDWVSKTFGDDEPCTLQDIFDASITAIIPDMDSRAPDADYYQSNGFDAVILYLQTTYRYDEWTHVYYMYNHATKQFEWGFMTEMALCMVRATETSVSGAWFIETWNYEKGERK